MLKKLSLFIVAYFFTTPFLVCAMEFYYFSQLKKINAVAFITETSVALASPNGLHMYKEAR